MAICSAEGCETQTKGVYCYDHAMERGFMSAQDSAEGKKPRPRKMAEMSLPELHRAMRGAIYTKLQMEGVELDSPEGKRYAHLLAEQAVHRTDLLSVLTIMEAKGLITEEESLTAIRIGREIELTRMAEKMGHVPRSH